MRKHPNSTGLEGGPVRREVVPLSAGRRKLAERYVPLALSIARDCSHDWSWIRDEMESAALVALVDAARTFDPSRKVRFATFLRKRVIGAMMDTRRQMSQSYESPDRSMTDDDDRRWLRTKSHSNLNPDEVLDFDERIVDSVDGEGCDSLFEVHDALRSEFRKLPARHREVMDGIYLRHLSFDELARNLGCSRTRLIAVHRESIDLLTGNRHHEPAAADTRRRRRRCVPGFPKKTEPNREPFENGPDSVVD